MVLLLERRVRQKQLLCQPSCRIIIGGCLYDVDFSANVSGVSTLPLAPFPKGPSRTKNTTDAAFFAYSWKLPAYSGASLLTVDNLSFLLTIGASLLTLLASLLTVGAFLLTVGKCV